MGEMEELHAVADDQSHYEISLTAGQAFAAFVLLLLSLAASFAFGLMMGKGQADDRLVVRRETPVVTEAALTTKKNNAGRIVELGVDADEFQAPAADDPPPTETTAAVVDETAPVVTENTEPAAEPATATVAAAAPAPAPVATPPAHEAPRASAARVTTYAQLLSTSDQRTAENLAARLIDRGFTTSYVERGSTDKGPIYRVRVKFDSDADARAAEGKLKEFSRDVWITSK
jgi:cell division septation protein DedD